MTYFWIWRKELLYILLCTISAAILSYFIGFFAQMVVLLMCFIICRQAILLSRLEHWLRNGGVGKVPVASGVWGDIYNHFYKIKKSEKQRKKKLGKIIDQFRKSTDVLPDAAIVLGNHNEIKWSNKLAKQVLGIKKSDKGQRINNLIRTPEFVHFVNNKKIDDVLTLPSPINENIILQFRIVSYGKGQHLVIAHDVTQHKNIEAMRKNFVDNVSHELRTPITVLKGYIETLQDYNMEQPPMLTVSLAQMSAQTERMQYLVDDLLLLAGLETKAKKKECVNVGSLITRICTENQTREQYSQQRIELSLETESNLVGEEQELQSAFSNLLINALKYSDDNTPVKAVWKKTADALMFEVVDQGEGISEVDIPRITERFYRVDVKRSKKLSGTGLGLAIVKHVLIRHNARLDIKSKIGKGSQFSCVFPLSLGC